MSTVNSNIQIGKKDAAFFAANPTLVLLDGQLIYNEDTGDLFIGDGVTQLNALVAINGGGGGVWGSITGTLSNQTDLQNALNAKLNASEKSTSADQVVITNGSNVLTSLSLGASQSIRRNAANNAFEAYTPSSGGVGLNGIIYSGQYKLNGFFGGKSNSTNWANIIWSQPYPISIDHVITEIGMEVTTNVAGATLRLSVHADNLGEPGALIEESGLVNAATAGFVSYAFVNPISLLTSSKVVWFSFQVSSAAVGFRVGNAMNFIGKQTTGQTSDGRSRAFTYGAFPNPLTGTSNNNFSLPCMWVKVQ